MLFRSDDALSPAEALAKAARALQVSKAVGTLKDQYRQSINTSGQDDVHRRVAEIKGTTPQQRKDLLAHGYQAREADRTSSLRDELQESTKSNQQKLAEDLNRIQRLVKLGAENGGLTRAQGIKAAAMKTQESGLGGPTQFAGAVGSNSVEGRSYLLQQLQGNQNDPVEVARQGLQLTGQGNGILADIRQAIRQQPTEKTYSM